MLYVKLMISRVEVEDGRTTDVSRNSKDPNESMLDESNRILFGFV